MQQNNRKKQFIPFIMAGDPSEELTIDLALSLQKYGATAIELGVPYSDPLADGPVIQRASIRARKNGMNIEKAIYLGKKLKENGVKIPIILFTYFNPVLQLGENRFFALMQQNNIDGLLIPDLPFEESSLIKEKCGKYQIDFISMVAPTSNQRIEMIAKNAEGFLYCVSSLGVTGERRDFDERIEAFIQHVKAYSSVPVVVGFGISKREHVEKFYQIADGVVIGSAIIRKIESLLPLFTNSTLKREGLQRFEQFLQDLVSLGNERGAEDESQRTIENVKALSTGQTD
jgi:tryptophan synthase alpha chain